MSKKMSNETYKKPEIKKIPKREIMFEVTKAEQNPYVDRFNLLFCNTQTDIWKPLESDKPRYAIVGDWEEIKEGPFTPPQLKTAEELEIENAIKKINLNQDISEYTNPDPDPFLMNLPRKNDFDPGI